MTSSSEQIKKVVAEFVKVKKENQSMYFQLQELRDENKNLPEKLVKVTAEKKELEQKLTVEKSKQIGNCDSNLMKEINCWKQS